MRQTHNITFFRRLSLITLASVYILILIGGIVRSTGSGMGCPDWPKCFGSWVPPTEADQLPTDYKEIYAAQRAQKNERFTAYLDFIGFPNLAEQIRQDKSILVEEDFNAVKTWTEYLNRLFGAIVGLLILATFLASLRHFKSDNKLVTFSLITLIAVGIQGWIGSIVVSTNLLPWMITVHMLLALVIVALLTYLWKRASKYEYTTYKLAGQGHRKVLWVITGLLILTIIQIVMGTQVRESVDTVSDALGESNRSEWINNLGLIYYIHRSYSLLVLSGHIYLVYLLANNFRRGGNLILNSLVLLTVIVLEIVSGAVMGYFAIPKFAQPIHLSLAALAFGIQFLMLLKVYSIQKNKAFQIKGKRDNASYQIH
ncbi:MAG: COX15/CtaA family protein [Cyclobacteriaceae bacterium]